jgi:hypothetical protein
MFIVRSGPYLAAIIFNILPSSRRHPVKALF